MLENQIRFQKVATLQPEFAEQTETIEQLTKQVAKGGTIAIGGNIVGKVFAFALSILLGRVLGPAAYGLYALGMSVIGIAQSIAPMGITNGVVRFCAMYRGEGDKARVKGTILIALGISTISSIVVSVILFVSSGMIAQRFFNEPQLTLVLKILVLALPFSVLTGVAGAFALSFRRIEYQMIVGNIFRPLVNLALVGLAFLLGFRLAGAIYGLLASTVLGSGLSFYYLWKIFPDITSALRPTLDEVKKLIQFSIPMVFVTMSYFLALKTDCIMLGLFRDAREVGIYTAASNIALQLIIIHGALVTIFMPIISDVYNRQEFSRVKEVYHRVKRWSSYGTFMLILPVIFYSNLIMSIYGNAFVQGWPALMVLPAAYIVMTITGPTGALLQMTGRQNIEFLNGVLMVTSNVLFNYLLIPHYGYLGAAIATLLASLVINLVQVVEIRRSFDFSPFSHDHVIFIVIVIFGLFGGATISVYLTGGLKLFSFVFFTGVYIIYGYKSRTEGDKAVWEAIKRKLATVGGIQLS